MIGASDKWKLLRYAFGPVQDSLSKKVEIPLLMIRAYEKEEEMLSTSELGEGKEEKKIAKGKKMEKEDITPMAIPVDDDGNPLEPQVPVPKAIPTQALPQPLVGSEPTEPAIQDQNLRPKQSDNSSNVGEPYVSETSDKSDTEVSIKGQNENEKVSEGGHVKADENISVPEELQDDDEQEYEEGTDVVKASLEESKKEGRGDDNV